MNKIETSTKELTSCTEDLKLYSHLRDPRAMALRVLVPKLEKKLLFHIFQEIKSLESFKFGSDLWVGRTLTEINDCELPKLESSDPDFRAWLIELDITINHFVLLMDALCSIRTEELGKNKVYKREDYLHID